MAGNTQAEDTGYANRTDRTLQGFQIVSSPRGESGEGRVRIWGCIQHFRFSFVHVFNGYVASLSNTIN